MKNGHRCAIALLLASGCAATTPGASQPPPPRLGVRRITCQDPPPAAPAGRALAVAIRPLRGDEIAVGELFRWWYVPGLDMAIVISGSEFTATLASDLARVLGGKVASDEGAEEPRLEVEVREIATTSAPGAWRGTVRSRIALRTRACRGGCGAWDRFEAEAGKRIFYLQLTDHEETLGTAYCRILEQVASLRDDLLATAPPREAGDAAVRDASR
jgi:hypothetical protein